MCSSGVKHDYEGMPVRTGKNQNCQSMELTPQKQVHITYYKIRSNAVGNMAGCASGRQKSTSIRTCARQRSRRFYSRTYCLILEYANNKIQRYREYNCMKTFTEKDVNTYVRTATLSALLFTYYVILECANNKIQ